MFEVSQCEGIERKWEQKTENTVTENADAEAVVNRYKLKSGVEIRHGGSEAYYSPTFDHIVIPEMSQFISESEYYGTEFHEMVHSTGHESRLHRDFNGGFGSQSYSKEELVAEIGASALCTKLGIATEDSQQNSAAYVAGWLKKLRNDKTLVMWAAGKAEKAVEYIMA